MSKLDSAERGPDQGIRGLRRQRDQRDGRYGATAESTRTGGSVELFGMNGRTKGSDRAEGPVENVGRREREQLDCCSSKMKES